MKIHKSKQQDIEKLIPIYNEFLEELGISMSDEQVLYHLMLCCSDRGILYHAKIGNDIIGLGGGFFVNDDNFYGDVAYIKPMYRNKLLTLIKTIFVQVKNKAKYWNIICDISRQNLWEKLGFDAFKVHLRRVIV